MKKKIAILGSTGSIGKSTLEVINNNKKDFDIYLLSANNNYKQLIKQAKRFKVRNVLIKNENFYKKVKKALNKKNTKVYTGDISLKNILNKKMDYTMCSIVGIAGLRPTIDAIKTSKSVAIANKESIICGWEILKKIIKKYKTKVYPVDSEHFSIMELTKNVRDDEIQEILITASGGPFLNTKNNKLKKVTPQQAIKHPNWKMGKKISIDSANLMNKLFEVIEASKIFNFNKNKYKIIIHPQSYVHSIIKFKNGLIKMVLYETDMKIPISNILFGSKHKEIGNKNLNIHKLSELKFKKVNTKKFPSFNLVKKCLDGGFLAPTIINASNEVLVDLFLLKKIKFLDIVNNLSKIIQDKDFKKYAKKKPQSIKDIEIADNWGRLKTMTMCVR